MKWPNVCTPVIVGSAWDDRWEGASYNVTCYWISVHRAAASEKRKCSILTCMWLIMNGTWFLHLVDIVFKFSLLDHVTYRKLPYLDTDSWFPHFLQAKRRRLLSMCECGTATFYCDGEVQLLIECGFNTIFILQKLYWSSCLLCIIPFRFQDC